MSTTITMIMCGGVPPVRKQVTVNAGPERAFRLFTEGMDRWWTRGHHIGASPLRSIQLEPRVGGRWATFSEDGSEGTLGKVLRWEPPRRLVLAWQINADWAYDPGFITEIEVRFTAVEPELTRVDFEHRNLEQLGRAAAEIRGKFDDAGGWYASLERFAALLAGEGYGVASAD
jgi:uncharacterized protein YndB with AHSA1/START domain